MLLAKNVSSPSKAYNEDLFCFKNNIAILLDGSTPLSPRVTTDYNSDGEWFVNTFCQQILACADLNTDDILTVINKAIKRTKDIYYNDIEDAEYSETPSAAAIIVRELDGFAEIYSVGDCVAIVEHVDGQIEYIHDNRVTKLDEAVIQQMIKISNNENVTVLEARDKVDSLLLANRKRKNKEDGYDIISLSPLIPAQVLYRKFDVASIKAVHIMTDGFFDYFTLFNKNCIEEIVMQLNVRSFQSIVSDLRKAQKADSTLTKFPRLKVADDATCASISFHQK